MFQVTREQYFKHSSQPSYSRPVLTLMYLTQYCPGLTKAAMKLLKPEYLAKIRDSRNAMVSDKYK